MSDRSRSPEAAAAPAAPVVQTASTETTGDEVKLYLGNLSYDTDEHRIKEKFSESAQVSEPDILLLLLLPPILTNTYGTGR